MFLARKSTWKAKNFFRTFGIGVCWRIGVLFSVNTFLRGSTRPGFRTFLNGFGAFFDCFEWFSDRFGWFGHRFFWFFWCRCHRDGCFRRCRCNRRRGVLFPADGRENYSEAPLFLFLFTFRLVVFLVCFSVVSPSSLGNYLIPLIKIQRQKCKMTKINFPPNTHCDR